MICDVIPTSSISFWWSVPASFSPTHQSAPAPVKSEIIKKAWVVLNNSAEHGSPEHGAPFIIDAFPLILPKTGWNLFVYVLLWLGLVSMYGVVFHYYRKKR
jgi:LPXTG-motif cell wall-anchored protein